MAGRRHLCVGADRLQASRYSVNTLQSARSTVGSGHTFVLFLGHSLFSDADERKDTRTVRRSVWSAGGEDQQASSLQFEASNYKIGFRASASQSARFYFPCSAAERLPGTLFGGGEQTVEKQVPKDTDETTG